MEKIRFDALPLSAEVQQAIADMGFTEATTIQSDALPHLLEGRDLIGQSQTGTGKTAAFGIPILERIDAQSREVQAIILCPTRELAVQVTEEISRLAAHMRGVSLTTIFGGDSYERQLRALRKGVQIVVGTPGRVIDHLNRGTLQLDAVRFAVLDEADEMLAMGFRDDIESILTHTPAERQTILFSATMSPEILALTKKYQRDPHIIRIARHEVTTTTIEQHYFEVRRDMKAEALIRLIRYNDLKLMLVFCNTKRMVDELVEMLQTRGFNAEALHGDLRQAQRTQVMGKFKSGVTNILVATDVAARGIDVNDVDAVFNYDIPDDPESYVHRIGRTGRAGRAGKSFAFVSKRDQRAWRDVMRYIKTDVALGTIPTAAEMGEMNRRQVIAQIKATIETGEFTAYDDLIDELAFEGLEARDVIASLLKLRFASLMEATKEASFAERPRREFDRDDRFGGRGERRERPFDRGERRERTFDRGERRERFPSDRSPADASAPEAGMTRLFFNIGKRAHIRPGDFVGAIAGETQISGRQIGAIDMYDTFSFVDVSSELAQKVVTVMDNNQIKGMRVNVEVAK